MSKNLVVLIKEDPEKTHRASEAIRIALGLSTGPNPLTIVLLDKARLLISEEAYELPDGEMLEKYLPAIQNLEIPIIVPRGSKEAFSLDAEFSVQESEASQISSMLCDAERVLVF